MVKTLYLIRHAKANEMSGGESDKEREINATGQVNAAKTGRYLFEKNIIPDIIYSSPAVRAVQTANFLAEQLKLETDEVELSDEIYDASVRSLLQIINKLDETWQTVFIVGHNPAISYLAEYLTGDQVGSMPTCGVTAVSIDGMSWQEVTQDSGRLEFQLSPELIEI